MSWQMGPLPWGYAAGACPFQISPISIPIPIPIGKLRWDMGKSRLKNVHDPPRAVHVVAEPVGRRNRPQVCPVPHGDGACSFVPVPVPVQRSMGGEVGVRLQLLPPFRRRAIAQPTALVPGERSCFSIHTCHPQTSNPCTHAIFMSASTK